MTNAEKVRKFMESFGQPVDKGFTDPKGFELGMNLIREEMKELQDEVSSILHPDFQEYHSDVRHVTRHNFVKELADLLYVVYWMADHVGVDLDAAFDLVWKSNMSKLGADGKPIYREDGKVLKGENYFAPNLTEIVKQIPYVEGSY